MRRCNMRLALHYTLHCIHTTAVHYITLYTILTILTNTHCTHCTHVFTVHCTIRCTARRCWTQD
jgi:hypothetical protein